MGTSSSPTHSGRCRRGYLFPPARRRVARRNDRRHARRDAGSWRTRPCVASRVRSPGRRDHRHGRQNDGKGLHRGRPRPNRFNVHSSAGNLNSREGLPLALMSLRRDHQVSVLEVAMDSTGEIAELAAIAEPEIGAVLNIGFTHVSKLGSIDAIAAEKLSLVRGLPRTGTALLNADDPRIAPVAAELGCSVITFGCAEEAALRRGQVTEPGTRWHVVRRDLRGDHGTCELSVAGGPHRLGGANRHRGGNRARRELAGRRIGGLPVSRDRKSPRTPHRGRRHHHR